MPRGWGRKYEYDAPPRKAVSAYSYFVQDWYRYCRRILRTRNPHRVIRHVAVMWKRTEAKEKNKYIELAKWDKKRAKEEKLSYYAMIDRGEIPPPPLRLRKSKQPGYPRPTRSAYIYFSNEMRRQIRREKPNMPYVDVMRELGRRWKKLSDQEKKRYRTRRDNDKQRYRDAKRAYRQRQKEEQQRKRREQGRERLNRLFNRRVPKARPQPEPAVQRVAA